MKVKGFSIPTDIPLMIWILTRTVFYRRQLASMSLEEIMRVSQLQKVKSNKLPAVVKRTRLEKTYRLISWYYRRILKVSNPCFVRSLVIYEQAKRMGLDVQLIIGFQKNDQINGHGWILLDDEVFIDSKTHLEEYTEIISW